MHHLVSTPELALSAFALLCRFALVSCAGYLFCTFLTRLATSAGARFAVWAVYMAAAGGFWLHVLASIAAAAVFPVLPVESSAMAMPHPALTVLFSGAFASLLGSVLPVLAGIYALVVVVLVTMGAWQRKQLGRALSFRTAPSPSTLVLFRRIAAELKVSGSELWVLPGLPTPATIGTWKPAVYLPHNCPQNPLELESILRHELCHLRRRDNLWENAARVCRSLLFFHPLVSSAFGSMRFERELACDMEVVRTHPGARDSYADTLVRFGWIAREARVPNAIGVRFAARASVLHARVRSVLAGEQAYSRASRRQRLLAGGISLWLFASIAPALSIGFDLARSSVLPAAAANAPAPLHAHRTTRMAHSAPARKPEQDAARVQTAPAFVLPEWIPAVPAQVRYASSHTEQPTQELRRQTSTETEGAEESTASPGGSAPPSRGVGVPSATSVLIDAAVGLARLGLSRGHDHDHD